MKAVAVPSPTHLKATGDCYRKAIDHLFVSKNSEMYLVHGRPTLQVPPYCQYGHAWLEVGDVCIDGNSFIYLPKLLYYAVGKIHEDLCLRYTKAQVRDYLLDFKHYGPWEGVDSVPRKRSANGKHKNRD